MKHLKKALNNVPEDQYDDRHRQMMTELRIRKMLSREKISHYPDKLSFDQRKQELKQLYSTFKNARIRD